jgi:hypothetical protein
MRSERREIVVGDIATRKWFFQALAASLICRYFTVDTEPWLHVDVLQVVGAESIRLPD